jgi:ABC-type phosphate transport system ATPase subunit
MEQNINRDEFNGLVDQISRLREEFICCKATTESEIMHINEEQKEHKMDIIEIKESVKYLSDKFNEFIISIQKDITKALNSVQEKNNTTTNAIRERLEEISSKFAWIAGGIGVAVVIIQILAPFLLKKIGG